MKRKFDGTGFDAENSKKRKVETEVQISTVKQLRTLFLNNEQQALSLCLAQSNIEAKLIVEFISSADWPQYSFPLLKQLADGLNQHRHYLAALGLYFEAGCALGCHELVGYMLESCPNLEPEQEHLAAYKVIFLAYEAARNKLNQLVSNNITAKPAQIEFEKITSDLENCFNYLLYDPRVKPNKYTFFLACLWGNGTAVSLLLNYPDINPNCLLKIPTSKETNDPQDLFHYSKLDSLIGWIIADDEDGNIANLLLKKEAILHESIVVEILNCSIKMAIQRNDSDSVINALKKLTKMKNNFLYPLLLEFDGKQMDAKPVFSYIVKDDSFDWLTEFEIVMVSDLYNLFYSSTPKLACDLVACLLEEKKFHQIIPTLVVECCAAQENLSTFKFLCKNIEKLSTQEVHKTIVLPFINMKDFCEDPENEPAIKSELMRHWLATISFPKAKLLFASRFEPSGNHYSFFHLPNELIRKIMDDYVQLEQDAYKM